MPTYDKLEYVCPAFFLLLYDKVERKKTRRDKLFPSAAVALMRVARKFKLIFLNIAIKHKITNNLWYGPPHFMVFLKL